MSSAKRIPYSKEDNYAPDIIGQRQKLVEEATGLKLQHISHYSFDPHVAQGNIENFIGVAQIPIGVAGPLLIHGEHAQGEFYIPMATSEGTLVASYSRGMKLLSMAGGVHCTVTEDQMQRAPVFVFQSAREAREFGKWITQNMDGIRAAAQSTSRIAKLKHIECYQSNKFLFTRFNYYTGDAAGQNMVGRATYAACLWMVKAHGGVARWFLESNFATDKKGSQINSIMTRGKRVTAECTIPAQLLKDLMRTSPESLFYHYNVANVAGFLAGVNNNGAHSPNGITAMFIATGQDVANVSESSAGIMYCELTPEGSLYISITIPSLIVATFGGGTGLPTQQECMAMLGCEGKDKVNKLAEIVAGVVLAGELSLSSAISSHDWVSSHEQYGRNR
ncbi:MAG: hydroxymethylglutaryl-CoA reductase [Blastocatellia bacterium]|nr:hydroxymethylglutaryl-CoA reductase [Blastocatellia bacterium]